MSLRYFFLFVLLSLSYVSFGQDTQDHNHPALAEKGLFKVSIMYPFEKGKTFDMDYYEQKHMPMVASYLGDNLVKYTIEKGVASGSPNAPLPYMAIGAFYVKDLEKYQAAIASHLDAIRADFPNYTNSLPIVLISKVIR